MNRRSFLQKTALSLPILTATPSLFTSCQEEKITPIMTDKKIIIIGAGIAGLSAANYFKTRNIDITILEAQNQVGGRLKTQRNNDIPFDKGASWIHGDNKNPITNLAKASGTNLFETDDDQVKVYDIDGTQYSDSVLDKAENEYNKILENLGGDQNQSFETIFYQKYPHYQSNRLWTYQLSAYLEFDTGADISELSSLDFYDDEEFSGRELLVTNGYDTIVNYMIQGIDIKTNTKIIEINYLADKTIILTENQTFEADFILLTVPLGVLKKKVISFVPTLPNPKQQAIEKLQMGVINKFLCVWDSAFWETDLQYIGLTPKTKGKFNYFLNYRKFSEINALMTFTFGNYSLLTEKMSDAEIIAEIMAHLKIIYGNNIPEPTQLLRTKWSSDEFTWGSYSFTPKGTRSTDYDVLTEAVEDKLFFAGEHTSRDYRGTVHGAFISGEREAKKIIELL